MLAVIAVAASWLVEAVASFFLERLTSEEKNPPDFIA